VSNSGKLCPGDIILWKTKVLHVHILKATYDLSVLILRVGKVINY